MTCQRPEARGSGASLPAVARRAKARGRRETCPAGASGEAAGRDSAYQYSFRPSWTSRGARVAVIWPKRSVEIRQFVTLTVHELSRPLAVRVTARPLRVVERVDEVGPELDPRVATGRIAVLRQRQVPLVTPRLAEAAPAPSCRRCRQRAERTPSDRTRTATACRRPSDRRPGRARLPRRSLLVLTEIAAPEVPTEMRRVSRTPASRRGCDLASSLVEVRKNGNLVDVRRREDVTAIGARIRVFGLEVERVLRQVHRVAVVARGRRDCGSACSSAVNVPARPAS